GLTNPDLADLFDRWHQGELNSFLVEITATIFRKLDPKTGKHLVDVILDVARQKGTGKWTSQEAMDLQVPLLTIDAAVALRDMSAYDTERRQAASLYPIVAGVGTPTQEMRQDQHRGRSTDPGHEIKFVDQLQNDAYKANL